MKTPFRYIFSLLFVAVVISACEKNVTVEVPAGEEAIVIEGYIETGQNPFVIVSKTLPFFGQISQNDVFQNLIANATVIVNDGVTIDTLNGFGGIYTSNRITGTVGRTYNLTVIANGKTLTATTSIIAPIPLDSTWFKVDGQRDSLGFAWGKLNEPDTLGNCYRWFARRINRYTFGEDSGKVKDSTFIAALGGSVFEDKFVNGESFDISFPRGSFNFSDKEDDNNDERFFFKRGDTIVVKFCTIDRAHYSFWRAAETQVSNNGNPFGSPQPVTGNINGGLGIWGGYSTWFDTIIAR